MNKKCIMCMMSHLCENLENLFLDVRRYTSQEWHEILSNFDPDPASKVYLIIYTDKYENHDFCLMVKSHGENVYFSPFKKSLRVNLTEDAIRTSEVHSLSEYDKVVLTDHEIHIRIYLTIGDGTKLFSVENIFGEIKIQR